MGDKSVETLGSKIQFSSILDAFSSFPQTIMILFFYFFDCTDNSTYTTLNWVSGGIRKLMPDAHKIE